MYLEKTFGLVDDQLNDNAREIKRKCIEQGVKLSF